MLTILEEYYQLEFSTSDIGNVHDEPTIEGYQYCMGLKRALESLISERYRSYTWIFGCIAVGISYCADNGHFKAFDSHARDVYGKSHAQGTCVLWDISSTDNLVHYFQSLWRATDLYELKGLQITKYNMAISNNVREVWKRYQVNTSVTKTIVLQ